MATVEPLSPTEEELWRAVMRIVKVIPRDLDSDLIRDAGLTASDYTTIMHLSEAPNRELRMADLATATDLSASRAPEPPYRRRRCCGALVWRQHSTGHRVTPFGPRLRDIWDSLGYGGTYRVAESTNSDA